MNKAGKIIDSLICCARRKDNDQCEQCSYFSSCGTENGSFAELAHDALKLIQDLTQSWIPFKFRPLTEKEKEYYPDWIYMMDCSTPDDEEEILVSDGKHVWVDTFYNSGDSCELDGGADLEGCAWMPMPKPWRKGLSK